MPITTLDEAVAMTELIYDRLQNRRAEIQVEEDYYNGNQNLAFASQEFLKETGARFAEFADNWTASVANAEGERIKLTGLKLRGADPMAKDEAAAARASGLWDQWNLNEMEAQSSAGFLTTLISKRSYVLVWGDGADAQITWEHPANVEIQYDWMNTRKRVAALKTWVDDDNEYATLYTPEFLWKFIRPRVQPNGYGLPQSVQMQIGVYGPNAKWDVRAVKGEKWPLKNPMGVVPIIEVKNRPMLRGEPQSEIDGVIPKQDAINLLWAYLFFAADYASMPARVLLGAKPPMRQILDAAGLKIGEEPVTMQELNESRFMTFSSENAKIDQWDAATLDKFTAVIDILVGHVASQTRTPPTYLTSKMGLSNVNAEGLKSSEIGLVEKVHEFQTFANPAMREIFSLTALAMQDKSLAEEVKLSTMVWANPEIRSEAQLADSLVKLKSIGLPREYLFELYGLDPYDMQRVMDMIDKENRDALSFGAHAALNDIVDAPVVDPNVAPV